MKTRFLNILLVLFSIQLIMSCSDKKENYIEPNKIPGKEEVIVIMETTDENNTAILYLDGKNIEINWGDGTVSRSSDRDIDMYPISHTYSRIGKEHVISVKAKELASFGNTTSSNIINFTKEEKLSKFKSISIGEDLFPEINIQASGVENLDITEPSYAYVYMDDNKLDLKSCKNNLYIYTSTDLYLEGLDMTTLRIYVKDKVENVEIKSCKMLDNFSLQGPSIEYPYKIETYIKNVKLIDLPKSSKINLNGFLSESIDLSGTGNYCNLDIRDIGVENPLVLNKDVKNLFLLDGNVLPLKKGIKILDISKCENLIELTAFKLRSLNEIITSNNLKKLQEVSLYAIGLKELTIKNAPELNTFKYYKDDDDYDITLDKIDISNNSNLEFIEIEGFRLKQIDASNNPMLAGLFLESNALNEAELLSLIASLDDSATYNGGTRDIAIRDNSGFTAKVESELNKLKYWNLH